MGGNKKFQFCSPMNLFKFSSIFVLSHALPELCPGTNAAANNYKTTVLGYLLNDQINRELTASQFYYQLSHYFQKTDNARPNFAKFWAEKAAEERDHADILAKFQTERGFDLKFYPIQVDNVELTMLNAYEKAIEKETEITENLNKILKVAEDGCGSNACSDEKEDVLTSSNCKAPHLADLLSGTFLPEQYQDIHALSKKMKQLGAMMSKSFRSTGQARKRTPEDIHNELFFDEHLL